MKLTSKDFSNNGHIPARFTCQGENINPSLQISEAPTQTQSLVLIVDDPDAATDPDGPGKTFDHWVLFNISPTTTEIPTGSTPPGAACGIITNNSIGYTGPCPPNGTHRYFFKLYALDTKLQLAEGAKKIDVESAMNSHIIDQTELIGLYKKLKT